MRSVLYLAAALLFVPSEGKAEENRDRLADAVFRSPLLPETVPRPRLQIDGPRLNFVDREWNRRSQLSLSAQYRFPERNWIETLDSTVTFWHGIENPNYPRVVPSASITVEDGMWRDGYQPPIVGAKGAPSEMGVQFTLKFTY